MTYEKFADEVKSYCRVPLKKNGYSTYQRINKYTVLNPEDFFLYDERCSGGITGGSCWDEGESRHYAYASNDTWDDSLKEVVKEFAPNLTFIQFDQLEQLYQNSERGESEYYGNSTQYQVRTISLKVLYDQLRSWGYLE